MVKTTVTRGVHKCGGKEYAVTVTKQVGRQEVEIRGRKIMVDALTITEYDDKRMCGHPVYDYTLAPEVDPTPEQVARRRQIIQQVASQIAADQGLWAKWSAGEGA